MNIASCDLLKIHYLCGDKDNRAWSSRRSPTVVICSKFITFAVTKTILCDGEQRGRMLWFAQNSLPLRWQRQLMISTMKRSIVVICSKFITFAVTKTIDKSCSHFSVMLWFAQNSLPLRWQRQCERSSLAERSGCDLLKIHYLCGDKDNKDKRKHSTSYVVICSKFITFAVTKTIQDAT